MPRKSRPPMTPQQRRDKNRRQREYAASNRQKEAARTAAWRKKHPEWAKRSVAAWLARNRTRDRYLKLSSAYRRQGRVMPPLWICSDCGHFTARDVSRLDATCRHCHGVHVREYGVGRRLAGG